MSYNGGKGGAGVYQKIINAMPRHRVYIETHLGGGSIMRHKKLAAASIGIEIDAAVIKEFEYSIGASDDEVLPAPIDNNNDGGHSSDLASLASRTICDGAISLVNMDSVEFLKDYDFKGDELVYCDPPYLFETRKSQKPLYKHEYSDDEHVRLLEVLLTLPCFVMISGYRSPLYMKMLEAWNYQEFTAQTRQGPALESLWCNFDPNDFTKHDISFIGDDFRERERIKRKKDRWLKKLDVMARDERDVIIRAIIDEYGATGASLAMSVSDRTISEGPMR